MIGNTREKTLGLSDIFATKDPVIASGRLCHFNTEEAALVKTDKMTVFRYAGVSTKELSLIFQSSTGFVLSCAFLTSVKHYNVYYIRVYFFLSQF